MNAAIIVLAVAFLVLAAVAVVFTGLRRRDAEKAVGFLSRETRSRDKSTPPASELEPPSTGREIELAAVVERRDAGKELVAAGPSAPVPFVPPDAEALGVSRRQFLNRGIVTGFVLGLSGFGASMLAFLWPQVSGGFGSKITVGKVPDIKAQIDQNSGFYYYPAGRMWITEYPTSALDKARQVYSPSELAGMEAGLVALYQKCVHLGCRVPECVTSQWFECPCHGSQYNQVGEKKGGPAPRGLDRFAMSVDGGSFVVDTGIIINGPPIGTNTTGQEAEGPHCITGGGEAH
jgi:cytochrome b6-f complex iron-sulfur subunit